jgi:Tfp pilus assembly protein PilE
VAISILTVLAGVMIPSVSNLLEQGNREKADTEMRALAEVFGKYKADTDYWPTREGAQPITTGSNDFSRYPCLYLNTYTRTGWSGPYLDQGLMVTGERNVSAHVSGVGDGPRDPWGQPYQVHHYADGYSGSRGGIMMVSIGPDRTLNTSAGDIFQGKAAGDDQVQLITYSAR